MPGQPLQLFAIRLGRPVGIIPQRGAAHHARHFGIIAEFQRQPRVDRNVVGKSEDVARQLIEAAGFTVKVIYDDSPTDQATGTVLEQNPPADTPAQQESQVVIIVTTYVAPSESPSPSYTDARSPSMHTCGNLAISPASASAAARAPPLCTTRSTSPIRSASSACSLQ